MKILENIKNMERTFISIRDDIYRVYGIPKNINDFIYLATKKWKGSSD